MPEKLVRLLRLTLKDTRIKIRVQNYSSESIKIKNGVRQGDALSCLLFNIALDKVIKNANIATRGNIFSKSCLILAFADDINTIARTPAALKQTFINLERETKRANITNNENKTKFMACPKGKYSFPYLEIGLYNFETVDSFTYLGSEVNIKKLHEAKNPEKNYCS